MNLPLNQRISFEDYLNTWKGIATSRANPKEVNPLLNQLISQPKLQAQHLALNANELGRIRFILNEYAFFLSIIFQLNNLMIEHFNL